MWGHHVCSFYAPHCCHCAQCEWLICGTGIRGWLLGGALRTTSRVSLSQLPSLCSPLYDFRKSEQPRSSALTHLRLTRLFLRYTWKKKMMTLLPLIICALIITALALIIGLSLVGKYEDGDWDVSPEVLAIPFFCILLLCSVVFLCWVGYFFCECFAYCRCHLHLCPLCPLLALTVPTVTAPTITHSAHCARSHCAYCHCTYCHSRCLHFHTVLCVRELTVRTAPCRSEKTEKYSVQPESKRNR